MHKKAELVQNTLRELGADVTVREFPAGTHSSADAAEAVGASVAQIAKSVVFSGTDGHVLVIASGANRVDPVKVEKHLGESIQSVDAKTVKLLTGFSVGGVPPVAHTNPPKVLLDADLLAHEIVWAAAGTPNAVFPIAPADLARVAGAEVVDIRLD